MKLLVCDVEGTIFRPHKIKSTQHASYIWTAIAESLGKEAESEEINTQRKWHNGDYGSRRDGRAYINWVNASIGIHIEHGLDEKTFRHLIDTAPYIDGVVDFFARLDHNKYIPILISGGIQNLNEKACRDLNIASDDSFAACKYFFNKKGLIDKDLTFSNTCDFYGKQELVKIALRKYGLGNTDWVFVGDGINDVSVAEWASEKSVVSIGISPVDAFKEVATHSFDSFSLMMADRELMKSLDFFSDESVVPLTHNQSNNTMEAARIKVDKQVGKLNLEALEARAFRRLSRVVKHEKSSEARKFKGIQQLLEQGELCFALISNELGQAPIVSALLQPFSNAAEIMIYVCLALTDKDYLEKLLQKDFSLRNHRKRIENLALSAVMYEYFNNRNISAHTSQKIPTDAAQTFIRRTYEIIQRLELIINPDI